MSDDSKEESKKESTDKKRQVLTEDRPGHLSQDEFGNPEYQKPKAKPASKSDDDDEDKKSDDKDYTKVTPDKKE